MYNIKLYSEGDLTGGRLMEQEILDLVDLPTEEDFYDRVVPALITQYMEAKQRITTIIDYLKDLKYIELEEYWYDYYRPEEE